MAQVFGKFSDVTSSFAKKIYENGYEVKTEKWQGKEITDTHTMIEILNPSFSCPVVEDLDELRKEIKPNLPWADDHFQERVGREPLNPGKEYKNWPYYKHNPENDKFRTEGEKFTHSYMERIWPPETMGIRYEYGNFDDVVDLLVREPFTRQAYLPIWYPEDTGVKHGGRVPCSLGYWFIRRVKWLHINYYIRSCDYIRHFRDDIYLASRKLLWLLNELRAKDPDTWNDVEPGFLTMYIGSLHCFKVEKSTLKSHFNK
jgi:thymidylate synthase